MIANTLIAAGAFVSLVAAVPFAQAPYPKRDVVWETETAVAYTTVPVTVTHWLEPGETAPSVAGPNKHYGHGRKGHGHGGHGHGGRPGRPSAQTSAVTVPTTAPAAPPASSAEVVPEAPEPSSYEQPAPVPTTTQAPPPPAPETTQQAPPPPAYETTQQAPPPAPETTQQAPPPAPEPTQPAAPSSYSEPSTPSTSGSNGLTGMAASGTEYTGDLTYYATGMGACGKTSGSDEAVVAMSHELFDQYLPASKNPNLNPMCDKFVKITGEDGSSYEAKIVDRCPGCDKGSLDLSEGFFKKVVPNGDGRVSGVSWTFA